MNDLISKADVCEILADVFPTDGEKVVCVEEIENAYQEIIALPSVQPEPSDAVYRLYKRAYEAGQRNAQPDIIRCKDCEYGEQDEIGRWYCRGLGCQIGDDDGNGFCSDAEKREE